MTTAVDGFPEQRDNETGPDYNPADEASRASRLRKSPTAFRTISEVADELHIPQHVLRFWETKFPQVKPLKRGGGRRYYRPDDIALLRRISDLLYIQGYTIKGVQRLLREGGGRLSDNIPPPRADERADVDTGAGQGGSSSSVSSGRPVQVEASSTSSAALSQASSASEAAMEAEVKRLHAALQQTHAALLEERSRADHLRSLLEALIDELGDIRQVLP
ncbi:Transcriptional regulator, MerR family [Granulibacter bethesdensis]|uniref:Transcriptional regulator, MerR family n=1 Tax=Granulibacter bethesdensis TaxID=364410 RepID=A0AAC9K9T5_9PROT|nr:MerR family transcriptional regulator [Granulibacter bethesdensis]APH54312.1 Transcriptional regulator, MerR family [Granulibacter bethesdensis]APH61897.1 Transcriptional regulator, MerR family [Granulibacter bethesdensis]